MRALLALLGFLAIVGLTVWRLQPPADYEGIDSSYVANVLERVASEPHPAGSAANDRVRDFLRGELQTLGFSVEEQRGELPHWR